MNYFAYGSNMDGDRLRERGGLASLEDRGLCWKVIG